MAHYFNRNYIFLSLLFLGMFLGGLFYSVATLEKYAAFTRIEYDARAGEKLKKLKKNQEAHFFWEKGVREFRLASPKVGYYPSIYEGYRQVGSCFRQLGLDNAALKACNQALSYHPYSITDLALRAGAATQTGDDDLAIKSLELCRHLYPFNWRISFSLADAYRKTGKLEKALPCYLKAWKQRPESFPLFVRLVDTYAIMGNLKEAKRITKQMAAKKLNRKNRRQLAAVKKYLAGLEALHGKK